MCVLNVWYGMAYMYVCSCLCVYDINNKSNGCNIGGCQVANGIGITVLLASFSAYIAIFEHRHFPQSEEKLTTNLLPEERF